VTEFALAGQEYPFTDLTDFFSTVKKITSGSISDIETVGIIGMNIVPSPIIETLKGLFSKALFVSAGSWITDLARAMKVSAEALEKTREMLKPGAIGKDVEAAGRVHVKNNGFGDYYVYSSCHSVGTVEAEEPVIV
jgi:Xaa-Pro aminopeptidase